MKSCIKNNNQSLFLNSNQLLEFNSKLSHQIPYVYFYYKIFPELHNFCMLVISTSNFISNSIPKKNHA